MNVEQSRSRTCHHHRAEARSRVSTQPAQRRGADNGLCQQPETSTRYIVIDPILRALGWELSTPTECVVEYAVARRGNYQATRVDYVLKDATGEPAIVIEAKRIDVESDDELALDQMERYLQDIPTATMPCDQRPVLEHRPERRKWLEA